MSLSKPALKNPVTKFIEFKGDEGVFQYWNKEKKLNVQLAKPFSFIVLDELNTIKGFNKASGAGIYSNEVHNLKTQKLHVRTFKGNLSIEGFYSEIKDKITSKAVGGKFCKSIYAALITGESLELVNFQLTGAAFKSWVDKEIDINNSAVVFNSTTDGKNGNIEFKVPNFTSEAISPELLQKAVAMDEALQVFLKQKKLKEIESKVEEESVQEHPREDVDYPVPDLHDDAGDRDPF